MTRGGKMDEMPIEMRSLPGSDESRRFEGADHGSQVSFFHVFIPPGAGPVLHTHPYEETFIVDYGEATFTIDGTEVVAGGGQIVIAPPNTPHKFVNSGDDTLHLTGIHSAPRMEQTDLE